MRCGDRRARITSSAKLSPVRHLAPRAWRVALIPGAKMVRSHFFRSSMAAQFRGGLCRVTGSPRSHSTSSPVIAFSVAFSTTPIAGCADLQARARLDEAADDRLRAPSRPLVAEPRCRCSRSFARRVAVLGPSPCWAREGDIATAPQQILQLLCHASRTRAVCCHFHVALLGLKPKKKAKISKHSPSIHEHKDAR